MTPHNFPRRAFESYYVQADPGDTKNIVPLHNFGVVRLITAAAETRTMPVPTKSGILLTINMVTDGGDCTLTVTSGYDETGTTTMTFSATGQFAIFQSMEEGSGTYRWRLIGYDGVTGPVVAQGSGAFDSLVGTDSSLGIAGQAAAQGGAVAAVGGASSTSANAGGAVTATGGAPGATGVGGAVTLAGAAGGATSGAGGVASLTGGAGTAGNSAGGVAKVVGGAGQGSAAGGKGQVTGGAAGATGTGGTADVTGGVGGATSGTGGQVNVTGGSATDGIGGAAVISGAAGVGTNRAGGLASVTAGAGVGTGAGGAASLVSGASGAGATGNGGAVSITGGAAASTNGQGGDITLTPGAGTGTGFDGLLNLKSTSLLVTQGAPATATNTATLTAANLKTGIIVGTPTAAASYTLPTGTLFEAEFSSFATDMGFDFSIINVATNATFIITVVAGAGWTLSGSARVDANTGTAQGQGRFRARRTAANTFTLYRIA